MGNKHDLANQRFGTLTVLPDEGKRAPDGSILWPYICDCGRKGYRVTSKIKKAKSCGKCKSPHKDNLVNQRFGRLTVIKDDGTRTPHGQVKWLCQCDCGNFTHVKGTNLKRKHTQSCGCLNKEINKERQTKNLTNQRFGKLVALYIIPSYKQRGYNVWKCKCDCGNFCDAVSRDLITGHKKSCGCLKSAGEAIIQKILHDNNISYLKEWTNNKTCKNPKTEGLLRFDFYLPDYNCCIEYDGIQHFTDTGWGDFNTAKERDNFKTQYCKNHNIKLVRLSYKELNKINFDYLMQQIKEC